MHPQVAEAANLPRVVAVAELDLDRIIALGDAVPEAVGVRTLPAATQDLSLLVPETVAAGAVLETVRDGAGSLLEQIRLVDDYRGTGVPTGNKSLTFALRFRASDRTLTAAEASDAKLAGAAAAAERFGASIRD